MRRQFFSLLLAVGMALSLVAPAAAAETGFSDIPADAWYADAVTFCRESGLMGGTSSTTFSPDDAMTRAMLVTVLYRAAGSPSLEGENLGYPFADVPGDSWCADGVYWARLEGVVSGYADNRFRPNDPVTREQLTAILWRSASSPEPEEPYTFADQSSISSYAADAASWARENGIVNGRDGNRFDPRGSATRAETAVILSRWVTYRQNEQQTPSLPEQAEEEQGMPVLAIEADGQVFSATLQDNPTTRALLERLPMTVTMGELNGNEKYYYLDGSLPTDAHRPGQIQAGDLMLYGSDCLVLFYESFPSSYSYTRLGSVDDPAGLSAALGRGSVEVAFQVMN